MKTAVFILILSFGLVTSNKGQRMVKVNRWVSPKIVDFITIPENIGNDAQLVAQEYYHKIFQYIAFLEKPTSEDIAAVNRWEMPIVRNLF